MTYDVSETHNQWSRLNAGCVLSHAQQRDTGIEEGKRLRGLKAVKPKSSIVEESRYTRLSPLLTPGIYVPALFPASALNLTASGPHSANPQKPNLFSPSPLSADNAFTWQCRLHQPLAADNAFTWQRKLHQRS